MTTTTLSDTNMRMRYLASDAGEDLTIEAGGLTMHSRLAVNNAVVLPVNTTATTCKTHLKGIDPSMTSVP
jgi:hypothetical protein